MSQSSYAQFGIKDKIQQKTDEKINKKIDETIDNGIDGVFQKKEKTEKETKEVESTEDNEMVGSDDTEKETTVIENDKPSKPDDKPKMESYTKYDFVPGDQILYYEDFTQTAIGDFPGNWTTNSSGEVKHINLFPGNWFHFNGDDGVYCYMNAIQFPTNFIMEFDIVPDAEYYSGISLVLYGEDEYLELNDALYPGKSGFYFTMGPAEYNSWTARGYNTAAEVPWIDGGSEINPVVKEQLNHVILWVQGRRVRIYHQGAKVLDMPTLIPKDATFSRFLFTCWGSNSHPYVSNIKVTTAAPDMRSKLLTEGKLVSYGIYFDSGKDVVKAESYGSLKEIAAVLSENPNVKIQIVGHTDSDGDDAMNLDLSKRRAANVKNSLVKDFGISADRIQTDGKGESVPLSPNTSTENKAKNRRVEFIKL